MSTFDHANRSERQDNNVALSPAARPALVESRRAQVLFLAGLLVVLLLMAGSAFTGYWVARAPAVPAPPPVERMALTLAPDLPLGLVRVPAGVFLMGSLITDTEANDDEKPQRKVYLDEFWIGQYEVTNAQYEAFARATGLAWRMSPGEENYPATNVSWFDAVAFCQWASRATGRQVQLPTEAQWEKAARGTDGRLFPWGDESPNATRLNYDLLVKRTTPVGRYSPQGDSPYGAADMTGNVWEHTSSLYWPYPYRANDGREEPPVPGEDLLVLRGGSFVSQRQYARNAVRGDIFPAGIGEVIGFRVTVASSTR
jgi:formylglycine-generating enzyme required for sulfatase activity